MSDNLNKRSTSFAKTVDGLVHQESALDRVRALKEEFERAGITREIPREKESARETQETISRSHAPKLEPHLKPSGVIRRTVDRKIDNEKLDREHQRAKDLNEACKKLDLARDWHKTRHHGR